jgi:hypothetical protein
MIKKTITYSDLDGNPVTDDFWFHLSKAELVETEMNYQGGLMAHVQKAIRANSGREIIQALKEIIVMSVGERAEDNKRFIKNEQIVSNFLHSDAYSVFFLELATDAEKSAEFVRGVVPAEMAASIQDTPDFGSLIDASVADAPQGVRTIKDYSRDELLDLSQEEFDELAGTDLKRMPQSILAVAMQRKANAKALEALEV